MTRGVADDRDAMPRVPWEPGEPSPSPPRWVNVVLILIIVGVLGWSGAGTAGLLQAHPAERSLPAPIRERVYLVPLGDFPVSQADDVLNLLTIEYGIPTSIFFPAKDLLDPSAFDARRRQFGAERLVLGMVRNGGFTDDRILVIGLTTQDLYIESMTWRYAFGMRQSNGVALISTARIHRPLELDGGQALFRKLVVRYVGFLLYGLPESSDRGDILYRDLLSLDDLVRMGDHL